MKRMHYAPAVLELVFLLREGRLGRRSLAQRTGLSEMTVRLKLEQLHKKGLVIIGRQGTTLSALGKERFASLFERIKRIVEPSLQSLALDIVTLAALLSCPAARPAWWYRDLVIKEGASSLVVLRYCPEGWCFAHNEEKIDDWAPNDERVIEDMFSLRQQGDLLLIVSAPDRKRAGLGLWRVIAAMLSETP